MFKLLNAPKTISASADEKHFRMEAKATDDAVELSIMDDIGENMWGEGVSAKDITGFFNDHRGKHVDVRINSFGGSVYDGMAIHNAIASHGDSTTIVDGIAYSAASMIFEAGKTRKMHEMSDLGIHRASSGVWGNAAAMRATADWLDNIDNALVDLYHAGSGLDKQQINDMLDGEDGITGTVMNAHKAVELGFADEVIAKPKRKSVSDSVKQFEESMVASARERHFDHALARLRRRRA